MERIVELVHHPERLDRDTLYELRSLLALYPYYQPARLLLLQNLYLLHDPTFDEELRRAAVYITNREVLFEMVEARHYQLRPPITTPSRPVTSADRTFSLIDDFLNSIPQEEDHHQARREPTPADAAVDYVRYLMETSTGVSPEAVPEMRGQELIDTFINNDNGKFHLSEDTLDAPMTDSVMGKGAEEGEEEYFTETLARIYVKQGRYSKALEIIRRLSLAYPKKNAYFADQIRFLEKLIINKNKK